MKHNRECLIAAIAAAMDRDKDELCPDQFGLESTCEDGCVVCWHDALEPILVPSEEETK